MVFDDFQCGETIPLNYRNDPLPNDFYQGNVLKPYSIGKF